MMPKRHFIVASEIRMNIVRIFRQHDIEIPFPQREHQTSATLLRLKKDEEIGVKALFSAHNCKG